MSGGRLGSLLAIAWVGLAADLAGCGGNAFTTSEPDGGSSTAPGDARAAAANPADASPLDAGAGWCATQSTTHSFCEDFLRGVPDKLIGISANAMLVPDPVDYQSPPQSMAAITPSLPRKNDSATALATHDFSGAMGTQFTLASYFKVASSCFPGNGGFDPVTIAVVQFSDQGYGAAITVTPSGVNLVEVTTAPDGGVTGSQTTMFDAPGLLDSWKLWTLTINGGIPKSIALSVDGTQVIPSRSLKNAGLALLQHPTLFLGAAVKNDQGLSPGCKVNVDDVLFDVKAAATP